MACILQPIAQNTDMTFESMSQSHILQFVLGLAIRTLLQGVHNWPNDSFGCLDNTKYKILWYGL